MKYIMYALVLVLFVQCKTETNDSEKKPVVDDSAVITNVLDQWHLDAAETNFDAYFNAMDPNGIFIGTDPGENWTIPEFKEFCKPYFDQGSAWDFKAVERNIFFSDDQQIAWFDELLDTWMGVCRGSGVLIKVSDSWKIKHYVLSLTIPNDHIQQVIELNNEKDSLFIERKKLLQ